MLRLFSIVDHLTSSVDGLSVAPCYQIDDEVVISEYSSAIGIVLNRPKALNSVNLSTFYVLLLVIIIIIVLMNMVKI